jgi:intein/homing endonuclease
MDPTSKLVNEVTQRYNTLCVVACGNNFGPMTVGAPGGAVGAITVGSVALKLPKRGVVSTFSSKGPTTGLLVKPEIAAYGGNILTPGISEMIYAAGSFGEYTSMAGTCLPGNTLITTSSGISKKIKDIQIDEIVYSFNEITKQLELWPVINKYSNGFKEVYCMTLSDRKIYATDNHPFYVKEKDDFIWKPLSDIKKGDDIICLKKLPNDGATSYNLQKYVNSNDDFVKLTDKGSEKIRSVNINSIKFDGFKNGTIYGLANQEYGTRKGTLSKLFSENNLNLESEDYKSSQKNINANGIIPQNTTNDFARLYGFMLGDGWITNNKDRSWIISFAEGEKEDINEYYCNLFKQVFNLELKLHRNKDAIYGWYYVYSKRVGDLLYNLGLKCSANTKHLDDWIFELPLDQKQSLITGLIDADGHTRQRSKNSIRHELELSSERLLVQIKCLCHQVGYQCTKVHKRTRNIKAPNSKKLLPHDSWNIQIHYNEVNNIDSTNFITRKVTSIEQYSYEEVFDITVENSHNFIADNVLVHNSMATPEVAGAMALLRQAKPDLSRIEVEQLFLTGYGTIRVDRLYNRLFSPRLPFSELGKPLQVAQSIAAVPLTMIPRECSKEQLNVVRLPVIRAN